MNRILASLILLAAIGCSSITGTGDDGFSQGEAEAIAEQFGTAFANGMGSVNPAASAGPAWSPAVAGPALIPINVQVQHRTNCTAGGHIEVSGNLTGNIDDTGSGALFLQILETISDWRCVGGRVVNGDPYLSAAGTFTFLGGQQSGTASISFGGGFKWGTTAAESCQLVLTALFRPDHTGRMSGVVCGRSVNVEF